MEKVAYKIVGKSKSLLSRDNKYRPWNQILWAVAKGGDQSHVWAKTRPVPSTQSARGKLCDTSYSSCENSGPKGEPNK